MDDAIAFDPALAGAWPVGRGPSYDPRLGDMAGALLLETKSEPSRIEELQALLNDMSAELRGQFETFRKIRAKADEGIDGEDEAQVKLAKADAKAAADALLLIIRAIEKVDGLQRTLAEERMRADEEALDDDAYQALLDDIERRIAARAAERSRMPLEERSGTAHAGAGPPGGEGGAGNVAP